MDLSEYLNQQSDGFIRIAYGFKNDHLPLKLAFTDEVKPYLPEPLKDWAEVTRLGEKLGKFGCGVKTWTAIERHG